METTTYFFSRRTAGMHLPPRWNSCRRRSMHTFEARLLAPPTSDGVWAAWQTLGECGEIVITVGALFGAATTRLLNNSKKVQYLTAVELDTSDFLLGLIRAGHGDGCYPENEAHSLYYGRLAPFSRGYRAKCFVCYGISQKKLYIDFFTACGRRPHWTSVEPR